MSIRERQPETVAQSSKERRDHGGKGPIGGSQSTVVRLRGLSFVRNSRVLAIAGRAA
jgi:hypothetical protein